MIICAFFPGSGGLLDPVEPIVGSLRLSATPAHVDFVAAAIKGVYPLVQVLGGGLEAQTVAGGVPGDSSFGVGTICSLLRTLLTAGAVAGERTGSVRASKALVPLISRLVRWDPHHAKHQVGRCSLFAGVPVVTLRD